MRKPHLTRRVRAGLGQMIELARQQSVASEGSNDLNVRIRQDNLNAAIAWTEAHITGTRNDTAEKLSDGTGR